MEKISVIIPTYNREAKIKKSIESVLWQTYTDLEVIIVDDGSEDNTREVVESIQDRRVQYIRLEYNQGAGAARNEGVRRASGSLIAFQDSDDIWRPEKLERQMLYWQKRSEFSLIYCSIFFHEEGMEGYSFPDTDQEGLEGAIFTKLLLSNMMGTPAMLMKKQCFMEVGGFDTSMKSLEDWDFAIRFSRKYMIGYVNEVLVDSYYSPGGVSAGTGAYYDSRCRMIAEYKNQMIENGVFEIVLNDLFQKAERRGVLEMVKEMLLIYIGKTK